MGYSEELDCIAKCDDKYFPDFLFNPLFNDFNDNYLQKSLTNTDLEKRAKGLRHKYADFMDYIEAMQVYNDYIDLLIERYGGKLVLKNAIKEDQMEDFVPAKPKLKNNRKNKEYMKAGVFPSISTSNKTATSSEYVELIEQIYPNATGESIDEEKATNGKLSKDEKKAIKIISDRLSAMDRRRNMYRSGSGVSEGYDMILDYLNSPNKSSEHPVTYKEGMSIIDMIREDEKYAHLPPELIEDEINSHKTEMVGGRLVYARDRQNEQALKDLYANGYDIFGLFTKDMDKQAVKMLRTSVGATEPMTKKELKKRKKAQKKEQKRIERRHDGNRELSRIMSENRISSDDLKIRFSDLMK